MDLPPKTAAVLPASPSSIRTRRRAIASCDICRRRKVRCDKQHPACSACRAAGRVCLYNESSTSTFGAVVNQDAARVLQHQRSQSIRRRSREATPRLDTIDARLGRLESVLEQIIQAKTSAPEPGGDEPETGDGEHESASRGEPNMSAAGLPSDQQIRAEDGGDGTLLVSKDGDSQYISSHHWSLLATELRDIREILTMDKDSMSARALPSDENNIVRCLPADVEVWYELLRIFEEKVDPVFRMVHKPSLRQRFTSFVECYTGVLSLPQPLSTESIEERLEKNGLLPFRPLVFAVLYAAVYSLSGSDVTSRFGDDRRRMMAAYHRGLHLSLMAVDVFSSPSIEVLQAFVLFLSCQLRDETVGRTFTLVAAANRLALSQGIHREPTLFRPVPDEVNVEIRRRVWAQLCYVEWRAAELRGVSQPYDQDAMTTRLPRNVDDSSLKVGRMPGLLDLSQTSVECKFTETTLQVGLCRMVQCARQIAQNVHGRFRHVKDTQEPTDTSAFEFDVLRRQTRELITAARDANMRYYQFDDAAATPVQRLAKMVVKMMEWKCWLVFWCGIPTQFRRALMPDSDRKTLLQDSAALLEMMSAVAHDDSMRPFHWLIQICSAFQSVMVLISELRDTHPSSREDIAFRHRAVKALKEYVALHDDYESGVWSVIRKYVEQLESDNRRFSAAEEQQGANPPFNGKSRPAPHGLLIEPDIFQGLDLAELDFGFESGGFSAWGEGIA